MPTLKSPRSPVWLLLALASCRTSVPYDADTASYTPVPYDQPGISASTPQFDAAAMVTAIQGAMTAAKGITGAPVLTAYTTVMATADDGCPSYYDYNGSMYWNDQCTTTAGSQFSGYSFYYLYDNYDGGDGNIYNGAQLYGVAQMWDPEGHELDIGGSAADLVLTATDDSYTYWYSVAQGSFAWDGAGTEGTWVTPGMAPDLILTALVYPQYDGHMFYINGGLSGLGGAYDTVVFDNLTLYDAGIGGDCPEEPGGTISVRDANGYWYDLFLDGQLQTSDVTRQNQCDGCADAWYEGQDLGPVCPDFSTLNTWVGAPW